MTQPDLQKVLLSTAYCQAVTEYQSWETYEKEQWLAFLKYGGEDLLDLSLALLSGARRFRYPLPALDLAAYTLAKFGLDLALATYPVAGYVPNQRTGDEDPCQFLELHIRMGATSRNRLHFSPHLLARCAVFEEDGPDGYLRTLRATDGVSGEMVRFAEREIRRIASGACPYEVAAERLCPYDPDAAARSEEFLRQGRWPSAEMRSEIEANSALIDALGRLRNEQPPE